MIELLTFAGINLLGTMSPGPDFAIVTRYGLAGARRAALFATLGISLGTLIHVFYCIVGIALIIQSSEALFRTLQLIGALYLGYLGALLLFKKPQEGLSLAHEGRKAFLQGFLTNLLNPKASLFMLSLFAQFVTPETQLGAKLAFGAMIPVTALLWFALLSYLLTHPRFYSRLKRSQRAFSRGMGALLMILALSVLVSALF